MPWTSQEFASRHNHALHGEAASKAASIANAVLRRSGDEGMSIAVANKYAANHPHRAFGGSMGHVSIPKTGGSGSAMMSPSMGSPWWTRAASHEITTPPHGMGVHGHFAMGGGMMPMGEASPWWERAEERQIADIPHGGGLIGGSGAGRTDRLPLSVAADSHIIPSDVVSGIAQGSSLAGARFLQAAMQTGPYGTALPHAMHGHGPPSPPHAPALAEGGNTRRTSILAASSEFVVEPHDVEALGQRAHEQGLAKKGEPPMETGHRLLDEMIARVRKFQIEWLRQAPPPKKSVGGAVL